MEGEEREKKRLLQVDSSSKNNESNHEVTRKQSTVAFSKRERKSALCSVQREEGLREEKKIISARTRREGSEKEAGKKVSLKGKLNDLGHVSGEK